MTAVTVSPVRDRATTGQASSGWPVDAAFVTVLGGIGIVGFRALYGGTAYLLVGLLGLVLGVAVTEVAQRWRQPVLAEVFVAVLAFVILGGAVAAPASALAGVVPTGKTISALGHVGVYGWKELLTTAPPVGDSSNLLALPYIIGLIGGVTGQSLSRRTRAAALPLLGPGLVLTLGILFGTRQPADLVLQGSGFAGLGLAWVALRHHRFRPVMAGASLTRQRVAMSAGLLAVAAVTAVVIGPHLPGAGTSRVVLSRYVVPPFEANQEPSPLAGFRQYVRGGALNTSVLFTLQGAPPGSFVSIATMDEYDGIVWGFGAGGLTGSTSGSDAFRRFGSVIPESTPGHPTTVTVHMGQLGGVWLPVIGQLSRVHFRGADSGWLVDNFRYDTSTATAAEPGGLRPGDTYTFTASVPATPSRSELAADTAGSATMSLTGVPTVLQSDASQWGSAASGAWARVMAVATHLRQTGYYSDGTDPTAGPGSPVLSAPGHGAGRLATFLEGGGLVGTNIVGDDEQYAAAFALMADSIGVPARVVMGAQVPSNGVVTGADVHPWVEVALSGLGWVPIHSTAFVPTRPAHESPPLQTPDASAAAPVQPPVVSALHSPLADQLEGNATSATSHFAHPRKAPAGPLLPDWLVKAIEYTLIPLAALAAVLGSVSGLKRRRRNRRRRAPTTAGQIAGAWAELIDAARDLGRAVPARRTRSEQAVNLQSPSASTLASLADAAVFAPEDPSDAEVAEYWESVHRATRELRAGLGRSARWRAAFSLRSFRSAEPGVVL